MNGLAVVLVSAMVDKMGAVMSEKEEVVEKRMVSITVVFISAGSSNVLRKNNSMATPSTFVTSGTMSKRKIQ